MTETDPLVTETMAAIYEKQGHVDKAAEIFRRLLRQAPDRADLADRLADLEQQLLKAPRKELVDLVGDWIELLLRVRELERLSSLKGR